MMFSGLMSRWDHAGLVRSSERGGHLDSYLDRFRHFHRAALETLAQGFAFN
jgi:hypothetical protein